MWKIKEILSAMMSCAASAVEIECIPLHFEPVVHLLVFNRSAYQEFATHYKVAVMPMRPRKPAG